MDPDRFARVRRLVEAAFDRPPDARAAFVARECGDDVALRREVEALLAADDEDPDYLEPPSSVRAGTGARGGAASVSEETSADGPRGAAPDPARSIVGARLGAWVVEDEMSSGGMGTVYRASRADEQFTKRVAIKVIKRGMDTDEVLRRFARERQVLASLEHPNIARLLDAGATGDGRPYLVMELVDGAPIDAAAAARGLDVRARVRLFCKVCAAVHHAHQRLVVHRDLKPSNILLTTDGEPKLLDFGIAKVLERDGTDTGRTIGTSTALTPDYASPEQVEGAPITTASDVYSLGMVLFELLAGGRPFDLRGRPWSEIQRVVLEQEPARPSRVAARLGRPDAAALSGELDAIVARALQKDPRRRYASAERFADDLRRYLDGFPIEARPDTWPYRTSRFLRRHRVAASLASLALISLIGGLTVSVLQSRRALDLAGRLADEKEVAVSLAARLEREKAVSDQRFQDLRGFARGFFRDLDPLLQDATGATPAREYVVTTGLEYLERLAADAQDDPSVLRDVVKGYLSISDLQGGVGSVNLGRPKDAWESLQQARARAQELVAADPGNPTDAVLLAQCDVRIALHRAARGEVSPFPALIEVLARLDRFEGVSPGAASDELAGEPTAPELDGPSDETPDELLDVRAEVEGLLAEGTLQAGRIPESCERRARVVALRRRLVERHPANDVLRGALSSDLTVLGTSLCAAGRFEDAAAPFEEAVDLMRVLVRDAPDSARWRRGLHFALSGYGTALRDEGRIDEALAVLREALELARRGHQTDPRDRQARRDVAVVCTQLAFALIRGDRAAEAEPVIREQIEHVVALHEADPDDLRALRDLAAARISYTRFLNQAGRSRDALVEVREAERLFGLLAAQDPELAQHRRDVAVAAWDRGMVLRSLADAAEDPEASIALLEQARDAFLESVDGLEALREQGRIQAIDDRYIERHAADARDCEARIEALRGGAAAAGDGSGEDAAPSDG